MIAVPGVMLLVLLALINFLKAKSALSIWHESSKTEPPTGIWILGNNSQGDQIHHGLTQIYVYGSDQQWRYKLAPSTRYPGTTPVPAPKYWTYLPNLQDTYLRST